MMSSIRWRIVMGTMLLTLLTVCAVGVVALLLMQRYMVQEERAYLTANAEAIAQQALPFMMPVQMAPPLQQLAQTAAFLGDVDVRIMDNSQMPLADSAVMSPYTDTVSIAPSPIYFTVAAPQSPQVWTLTMPALPAQTFAVKTTDAFPGSEAGSAGGTQETRVIVVQKAPSIWGDRLIFEGGGALAAAAPITGEVSVINGNVQWSPSTMAVAQAQPVAAPLYVEATRVETSKFETSKIQPNKAEVKVGHLPKSLGWETQVASYSRTMAQPTFLQSAGLQSTDMVTAPIQAGGMVAGFVELGRTSDLVDEPLGAIRRALAIAAGASALLAIGVGLMMSRTLTSPIQNLAQAAAAMSSGDLTARAPVVGRDELAALARQFNQMADALHVSFEELAAERDTLRRFVADASHELRTPITALRTFNELLQGPAQEDRSVYVEFLVESDAQIVRLEWITRNLLDLSRWDGGMATLTLAEVEVGDLVANAAAPFRAMAQERQIELSLMLPDESIMADVDEQRLGMAVANLLDNAIKFTPCAGKVEVGVCEDGQRVTIWVEDTGMGIGTEELPHIFERFYRSPRATQNGSGLGLAIVERIIKAHGATIDVESTQGIGSRFMISIGNISNMS